MKEKVILVPVHGPIELIDLDSDDFLHGLQRLVGGPIETLPFGPSAVLIVNEEGAIRDMPFNPTASMTTSSKLFGDCVIACVGLRDGEPDIIGLTPDFAQAASQILDKK